MVKRQDKETTLYNSRRKHQREKYPTVVKKTAAYAKNTISEVSISFVTKRGGKNPKLYRYVSCDPNEFAKLVSETKDRLSIFDNPLQNYVSMISEKTMFDTVFPEPSSINGKMVIDMNSSNMEEYLQGFSLDMLNGVPQTPMTPYPKTPMTPYPKTPIFQVPSTPINTQAKPGTTKGKRGGNQRKTPVTQPQPTHNSDEFDDSETEDDD